MGWRIWRIDERRTAREMLGYARPKMRLDKPLRGTTVAPASPNMCTTYAGPERDTLYRVKRHASEYEAATRYRFATRL